ncbi:MAG: hypothetical protein QM757_16470 [Paludibaculum sp.]
MIADPRMGAVLDLLCEGAVEVSAVEVNRLWCGQITLDGSVLLETPNVYASFDVAVCSMGHFIAMLRRGRAIERRPPGRAEQFLMLGEVRSA